jgi:membrane associated rhomboid family serine protease
VVKQLSLIWQLIVGSIVEKYIGMVRTAIIYFASGVGGVLFSSLISYKIAALEPYSPILGLLSAQVHM